MATSSAGLTYDRAENIVFVSFPSPVELTTAEEIGEYFDRMVAFWRAQAGGKKSYFILDFDNVDINIDELDYYAERSEEVHRECALVSVRYGGSHLQRTVARLAGMKVHLPSNLYATREEALAVVRSLKASELAPADAAAK